VWQLVGKLLVATDATVTNGSLVANPDSGVADVPVATAATIASLGIGTLMGSSGAGIGVALAKGGAISGIGQPPALDIGTIDILTTANQVAARAEWFCLWEPLFPGATLVPVLPGGVRGQAARPLLFPRWIRRRATNVPQTAQAAIMRVFGGPIILWALTGKVTASFSATATNLTVVANPLSGVADVNLCNATTVTSVAVANLLSLQAAGIGSALAIGGAVGTLLTPIVVNTGTIDLLTSASNATGQVEWSALWQPLHPAGRLVLA
jgi:hypothetical protein